MRFPPADGAGPEMSGQGEAGRSYGLPPAINGGMKIRRRSKMKKWFWAIVAIAILCGLLACGCAGNQPAAPASGTGAGSLSLLGKLSPEMQALGPAAIRAGVDTAMIIRPEIKGAVALACLAAWPIVKNGNIAMGVGGIMNEIKDTNKFAPIAVTFVSLLQDQLKFSLDATDQEIFCSLIKNIGIDAGLTAGDFK